MLHKRVFKRSFLLKEHMQHEEEAEDVFIPVEPVLYSMKKTGMSDEAELLQKISRAFPHDGEDLLDNRLEEADFSISKAGGEESGELDIMSILIPVGELYGVMQEPLLKIILPVKPVECAL